jgi:thiosulfate/3-mercaptopyruvate sulfurtransferase
MHRAVRLTFLLMSLLTMVTGARAQGPLVTVDWLKSNLGRPDLVLIDVRSGGGVTREVYLKGHVPGAVFTDYAQGGWREKDKDGVEGQLPPPDKLEKVIGAHGIGNDSHVVFIAEGRNAQDMSAATRLYWTLKVLGHDRVSVLDGGWQAWAILDKDKKPLHPIETGDVKPTPKAFKASVRHEMLVTREEMRQALAAGVPLVDNRPYDFHVGMSKSPAAKTAGTLPGARSVPEGWITENNGGRFRSRAQLAKVFEMQQVSTTGRQITFCNTGHWASLGWFAASEILGNKEAKLYSGSMADWTQDTSAPVERKVRID